MELGNEFVHYSRQMRLAEVGEQGQQLLKKSSVLIVGVGGLGCPIAQYLVSAGIGHIGIIDDDLVDVTNLHRQILFDYTDLGKKKVSSAKDKLSKMNPYVEISTYDVRLTDSNVLEVIEDYDLVIDAADNFSTTYLIDDACHRSSKPWIFGAIYEFEGHVSVFNYKGGPTYRYLFPEESDSGACSVTGVLGMLPGIIGSFMANEAVKIFLNIGHILSGRVLVINILRMDMSSHEIIQIDDKDEQICVPSSENGFLDFSIEMSQLRESDFLVDVREPSEHDTHNIGGMNIPLSEIEKAIELFSSASSYGKRIVFYCQLGSRSKRAAKILIDRGFTDIFSLNNGVSKLG